MPGRRCASRPEPTAWGMLAFSIKPRYACRVLRRSGRIGVWDGGGFRPEQIGGPVVCICMKDAAAEGLGQYRPARAAADSTRSDVTEKPRQCRIPSAV